MRILYFSRGDTAHDRRFLTALAASGHEIYTLRLERPGEGSAAQLPEGVHGLDWPGAASPANLEMAMELAPALAQLLEHVQPDVVHAGPIQLVARLVARVGFHPLLAMSWGSDLLLEADQDADWRAATLEALSGADLLVCDNLAVAEKAVSLGFSSERIVRFPWGVDLGHFSPGSGADLRASLGWQDAFILLCLRTWEPLYGVEVVAKAFVRAAHARPDLRLLLVGCGSRGRAIRRILEQGSVLDRVAFPGQLSLADLPAAYRAADLYLSASHSDGSSVSLLEAMACGKPALVSDIPGNREWITPGEQGWRFPDGDDGALADAILYAAEHRADLARMGQSARHTAEIYADWNKNFSILLNAYRSAKHAKAQPLDRE